MDAEEAPGREATPTWPAGGGSGSAGFVPPARWKLGRPLGSGGQADVWLAEDVELGQWVAIKVFRAGLSEDARERLRREVRLGRSLQHPSLVRLFELIESDGRLAVVMEWLPGGSVAQRLQGGPLPVADVARVADEALAALAYLHEQGVVHRDVKPSNLLLGEDGRARLADLGLARPLQGASDLTRTNMAVGTPAYMSPEQIRGETPTPAADLYGLGATLFQLLTGQLPFTGSSEFDIANRHLTTPVRDPRELRSDCPPWLARFLLRLMEKAPADRWPNAAAARRALSLRRGLRSPRVRRRLGLAAAAAGAAATAALLWVTVGYPSLRRGETVKAEAIGRRVRGLDARGRQTWDIELGSLVQQVERVDFDGDGKRETAVAAYSRTIARGRDAAAPSDVLVVRDDGTVLTRIHPEELVAADWAFPYPDLLTPRLRMVDLRGDGKPAMFVLCPQRAFYPFALLVYWPRQDQWDRVLLHSGYISGLAAVPGATPPRVRIAGVNNRLGFLPVVGEVIVSPPGPSPPTPGQPGPLASPDLVQSAPGGGGRFEYVWYTLLDQAPEPADVAPGPDLGSIVTFRPGLHPHADARVDRWGNPTPGPNAGRDLRTVRRRFIEDVSVIALTGAGMDAATVDARVAAIRIEAGALLAEAPYRALLDEVQARALAKLGRLDEAIPILERSVGETHFEDGRFRLVHLLALAGRLDDALALDAAMVGDPWADRGGYDGIQLLIRLAIERRDPTHLRAAIMRIGRFEGLDSAEMGTANAALAARAHLWWDQADDADCEVRSWSYAPDGDALACLARWRRGATRPDDVAAMERAISENPDATWEGQVALGAAELGAGRAAAAVGTLERAIGTLEPLSRDDFMNRQLLDLARALRAKALAAAGRRADAVAEAHRLRGSLRPGLLPRILVDEVLAPASPLR